MADGDVDPRFDPRYQRGFDPAAQDGEDRRSSLSKPPARSSGSGRPAPAEPSVVVPAPVEPAAPVHDADEAGSDRRRDDDLDARLRNPYRLALLIVSLLAIVAGIGIVWYAATHQSQIYGDRGVEGIFAALAGSYIAPGLVGGGVIGIALWAAVGALPARSTARGEGADADG